MHIITSDNARCADLAELADAYGSGPYLSRGEGSSPLVGTIFSLPDGVMVAQVILVHFV